VGPVDPGVGAAPCLSSIGSTDPAPGETGRRTVYLWISPPIPPAVKEHPALGSGRVGPAGSANAEGPAGQVNVFFMRPV
jgi:hypothetical protein